MAPLKARLAALTLLGTLSAASAQAGPLDRWAVPIAEASARFAVPEVWIRRVIVAESGGRARRGGRPIRSAAGAIGLMQLMPATWREMRTAYDLGPDPDDPHDNIMAGTAYLRAMYDRFGYPGLFGAYNAGPGRYAAHLATGRPLSEETRLYIARVTGGAPIAKPIAPAATPSTIFVTLQGARRAPAPDVPARVARASGPLFVPLHASE